MKRKIVLLNIFLCLVLAGPGWAASKSATIQVSCVVPPRIELSAASISRAAGQKGPSTEGPGLQMTEELRDRSGKQIRLYTLTAF